MYQVIITVIKQYSAENFAVSTTITAPTTLQNANALAGELNAWQDSVLSYRCIVVEV